jgi:hypothetical protein
VPFDPEDALFGSAFPRRVVPGQQPVQSNTPHYTAPAAPPQHYGIGRGDDREHVRDSNARSGDRTEREREKNRRDRERDKYGLQQQRQLDAMQQQQFRTHTTPPVPNRRDRGIIPPEEDIRRLFQECDVAKNNAQVLAGALPYAAPATFASDPVIQVRLFSSFLRNASHCSRTTADDNLITLGIPCQVPCVPGTDRCTNPMGQRRS